MMNDQLASSSYPIYGKSGTSDWGIYGLEYRIPQAAIRDEWSVGYSSAYTVACWSGYLTQYEQQGYYIPVNQIIYYNMAFEITDYLLDYMSSREQYVDIPRPDGITDYKGGYIKTELLAKEIQIHLQQMTMKMIHLKNNKLVKLKAVLGMQKALLV